MQDQLSLLSLKLLFYRYKETVYYPIVNIGILFSISFILLFQVVIPQVSMWFSVQREVEGLKKNIATMEGNIKFLSALDPSSLQNDVDTVTEAYPFSIDYAGIINALSKTAEKAGLPLTDFSLSIGDTNASFSPNEALVYPFTFTFPTDLSGAKRFVDELSKVLPIASVIAITNNSGSVTVQLQFYYHGYPQITINQKESLKSLNPEERTLLSELKVWRVKPQTASLPVEAQPVAASESGAFPPPL